MSLSPKLCQSRNVSSFRPQTWALAPNHEHWYKVSWANCFTSGFSHRYVVHEVGLRSWRTCAWAKLCSQKAKIWLGMAIFPPYAKCPDAARTSSQSQRAPAHHASRLRPAWCAARRQAGWSSESVCSAGKHTSERNDSSIIRKGQHHGTTARIRPGRARAQLGI